MTQPPTTHSASPPFCDTPSSNSATKRERPIESIAGWRSAVAAYQQPSNWRASWQLLNSIGAYLLAWILMYFAVGISWWLTVPLAIVAGGLQVRIFIIFHDCGHGSFFKSGRANSFWGFVCGMMTFTPYYRWRWEHNRHHARSGNLDHRGIGDIWTMTIQEYLDAPRWKRINYRLVRNPLILFIIGPIWLMLIKERLPNKLGKQREKRSVTWMNLAVLAVVLGLSFIFGVATYATIQLIVLLVAGSVGIWLFYVQHQFEDVYWERGEAWTYTAAALEGSSYYRLPRILQWFTGNIGFHHLHHLSPKIPNYNLQRCHESSPVFDQIQGITMLASMKCMSLRLWDESTRKLVGFGHLKKLGADTGR
jgi:omega-6 fatty acid desaturase (delta-12 desaturase)